MQCGDMHISPAVPDVTKQLQWRHIMEQPALPTCSKSLPGHELTEKELSMLLHLLFVNLVS